MCAGGCFCSMKTKLRSEEESKNGGKRKEMEEGRRAALGLLPVCHCGALTFDPGAGGPQQRHRRLSLADARRDGPAASTRPFTCTD